MLKEQDVLPFQGKEKRSLDPFRRDYGPGSKSLPVAKIQRRPKGLIWLEKTEAERRKGLNGNEATLCFFGDF